MESSNGSEIAENREKLDSIQFNLNRIESSQPAAQKRT